MKKESPNYIALVIAVFVLLFYSLFTFAIEYFYKGSQFLILGIIGVVLFIFTFFITRIVVQRFIYLKIRIIYKTINNLKSSKDKNDLKNKINSGGGIINDVRDEVLIWAEDKTKEIEFLQKQEKFRREFIGNVSHELKTPIFNIQGYILTLLDGGLEDENVNKEYLKRTEKSIERMIMIINDLETISKLESGDQKLDYSRFDIVSLAKEVTDFYEIKAKEKNISLVFNPNNNLPVYVNADKDKIRQVLNNLVENSIKYGNNNGKTKISFFDMDENNLIEVTDDGIGIAEEEVPRVFERFYRTNKGRSREQSGTGLGLSIVKHIIEAHNQTINVRSAFGVGTTFAFTLSK
jgi:two-component system phosphate regulon sensor histidine kinase PhoR